MKTDNTRNQMRCAPKSSGNRRKINSVDAFLKDKKRITRLILDYESGMSYDALGEKNKISRNTCYKILKKAGVIKNPYKKSQIAIFSDENKLKELIVGYISGVPVGELAEKFNASKATCYDALKKAGVTKK